MRTGLAGRAAAGAALSVLLCVPAHAARPSPPGPTGDTDGTATEAAAGAALVARRAAARATAEGSGGLDFRRCPDAEELPAPVRCATLRVPLDYARPDGPQISLTVSKVAATGARGAVRQGSLVHNPGGPGASGMYFPLLADLPGWERIAAAYDLVGYAPRGVGRSAPLSCQDPARGPRVPPRSRPTPRPCTRRSVWRPPGPTPAAARGGRRGPAALHDAQQRPRSGRPAGRAR